MISKELLLRTYTCDYKNNTGCNKKYCICNNGKCSRTTEYKYAKKNFINYIKKIINETAPTSIQK